MKNPFLVIASFFGAAGVGLGALGAHYIREKMKAGVIDNFQYDAWAKAAQYQLLHAIVLLFVFYLLQNTNSKLVKISGYLFTIGIIFFSGSIYLLATQNISGMNFAFLGPITPLGGLSLISGWICLLVQAFKMGKQTI